MGNNHINSDNIKALEVIAKRIKEAQDKQQTIDFDFKVKMKKGKIERLDWYTEMVLNFED